jgi:hypothetical protein
MAQSLSATAFRAQLGPIALIEQRIEAPLNAETDERAAGEIGPTSVIQPEVVMARMMMLALEREGLHVATLPPLRSRDELSVGRQPDCDLVIDDDSVSKRHAVLRWNENADCCTIEDLGSTNGTFVNTVNRIDRETSLDDGDIVSFGDVAFWFMLVDSLYARLARSLAKSGAPAR